MEDYVNWWLSIAMFDYRRVYEVDLNFGEIHFVSTGADFLSEIDTI